MNCEKLFGRINKIRQVEMSDDFDEYIVKFRYMSEYKNVYIKRADLDVDTLINLGKYFFD